MRHSLEAEAPKAFDLHVLGMPPAFVLSQDQTLKFIPDPLKGILLPFADPHRARLNVRSNAQTQDGPAAAVRASLPSSPQSQTTTPAGAQTKSPHTIKGPRL